MSLFSRTRIATLILVVFVAALHSSVIPAQTVPAPLRPTTTDVPRSGAPSGTIDGVVTDTNLVPLRGAFVSILSSRIRVGTGPNGRFLITNVPVGQYLLVVKRGGYRPTSAVVEVHAADTLRLSYTLANAPTTLDPVIVNEKAVTARMAEFEQRRRIGVGQFMTEQQIEQHNPTYATELFRRFMSVNVSPSRTSSLTEYFALSNREGANPTLGACPMAVFVDRVPMPTPFNLDLLPSPRELAGIEVYSGSATIPPQFNAMNNGCGVILVWTRDGS